MTANFTLKICRFITRWSSVVNRWSVCLHQKSAFLENVGDLDHWIHDLEDVITVMGKWQYIIVISFIKVHPCIPENVETGEKMPPEVLISPHVVSLLPWPLIFWPQTRISSTLHRSCTFGEIPTSGSYDISGGMKKLQYRYGSMAYMDHTLIRDCPCLWFMLNASLCARYKFSSSSSYYYYCTPVSYTHLTLPTILRV